MVLWLGVIVDKGYRGYGLMIIYVLSINDNTS
jgi:hypothetical protein